MEFSLRNIGKNIEFPLEKITKNAGKNSQLC